MRSQAAITVVQLLFFVVLSSAVAAQTRSQPRQKQVCSSRPPQAAYTRPWPERCNNVAAGFVCRSRCLEASYKASTVCLATGRWLVSTECPPAIPSSGTICAGSPAAVAGTNWPCRNSPAGTICHATCMEGFFGDGYISTCQRNGKWSAPSTAPGKRSSNRNTTSSGCEVWAAPVAACKGLPRNVPDAVWDPSCANSTPPGDTCTATCSASAGFQGAGYTALCTDAATWAAPVGSKCSQNAPGNDGNCTGKPQAMDGVVWEPCDTASPGARCTGYCKPPFKGMGYYTFCNETAQWAAPQKQLPNDVGCKAAACGGSLPAAVPDAVWEPACLTANASKGVCFAYCASGKVGYISECSLMTETWGEPSQVATC